MVGRGGINVKTCEEITVGGLDVKQFKTRSLSPAEIHPGGP